MLKVVRVVLLAVIGVLLLEAAIAVGSGTTGPFEKAVLVALAIALVFGASRVWRIGTGPTH
jgi:type IV secretory pathway VirB2 component (pilin)